MLQGLLNSPVTLALMAANIIVSLYAFQNRDFFEKNTFWIAPIRKGGNWHRMVTSAFLHVNPTHLFMNMFVLFFFGIALEGALGPVAYLFVYVASLLAGNAWELMDNWRKPQYRAVGASGATSGLTLSFVMFAPFQMIYLLGVIPMWSIVFGVVFIVGSFMLSQRENTMIAHGAHLGGALAGAVATILVEPGVLPRFISQVADKFG